MKWILLLGIYFSCIIQSCNKIEKTTFNPRYTSNCIQGERGIYELAQYLNANNCVHWQLPTCVGSTTSGNQEMLFDMTTSQFSYPMTDTLSVSSQEEVLNQLLEYVKNNTPKNCYVYSLRFATNMVVSLPPQNITLVALVEFRCC